MINVSIIQCLKIGALAIKTYDKSFSEIANLQSHYTLHWRYININVHRYVLYSYVLAFQKGNKKSKSV